MNNIEGLVILLTYLAVTASAISGTLEARKYDMDIVGATTVAFVTAFDVHEISSRYSLNKSLIGIIEITVPYL